METQVKRGGAARKQQGQGGANRSKLFRMQEHGAWKNDPDRWPRAERVGREDQEYPTRSRYHSSEMM